MNIETQRQAPTHIEPIAVPGVESDLYNNASTRIKKLWRGHQVRKHYISPDIYAKSARYLKQTPKLEHLPRAATGTDPVYFPEGLPVVFKVSNRKKCIARFLTMQAIRSVFLKNNYKYLVIPEAHPYKELLIEKRLPITELTHKEQIGLYYENKEKFSLAAKEFTGLLCQMTYPDILTSSHPYQKDLDIPLGRYDNIPFFLSEGIGKIGLVDSEKVEIRSGMLTKEDALAVARTAISLFPYHFDEVFSVLMEYNHEIAPYLNELQDYHTQVLKVFNSVYADHRRFVQEKHIGLPFVSSFREDAIRENILKGLEGLPQNKQDLSLKLVNILIDQIKTSFESIIEETPSQEFNVKDLSLRTLTLRVEDFLSNFSPLEQECLDKLIQTLIKNVLDELENGREICFGSLYHNRAGNPLIRIHY
jgi:hypothetical protein